jgi:hypothetical protein
MIRSGSTLQYNLARSLVENIGIGTGSGYYDDKLYVFDEEQLNNWINTEGYYVIKSHALIPRIERIANKGQNNRVKICYIFRDIRDVAVSAKAKWRYKDNDSLLISLDKAIQTYYSMKEISNVFFQKYEDLVSNIYGGIKSLSNFIELSPDGELIDKVVKECSLENMHSIAKNTKINLSRISLILLKSKTPPKIKSLLKKFIRTQQIIKFDSQTLLHPDHISENRGVIGIWRTALNEHEKVILTRRYKKWLIEAKYPLK